MRRRPPNRPDENDGSPGQTRRGGPGRLALGALAAAALCLAAARPAGAQPVDFLWAERAGGSSWDAGRAVATDGSGDVVVVGSFDGQASFGGTTLTSAGSSDVFVARYDPGGGLLWAKRAGGPGSDRAESVAVDASGNVLVTGRFRGQASFGGTTLTSAGSSDVFVARYDPGGNLLWAKRAGGSAGNDRGTGIAADAAGNVLVVGAFDGPAGFDGTTLNSIGSGDLFLARYDAGGTLRWVRRAGGPGHDESATGLAVDGSGAALLCGHFGGQVTFGGTTLTSSGRSDVFVARYDGSGTLDWARRAGGTEATTAGDIAVDGSGNAFVTGRFDGQVTFGGTTFSSGNRIDMFVAKYDAAGAVLWAKRAGASSVVGVTSGDGVATTGSGRAVVTGRFDRQADFGGTTLTSSGQADLFAAEYDGSGTVRWALQAGASSPSDATFGTAVAADGSGHSFVTGHFRGQPSFGGTNLTSAGEDDAFLAKIGPEDGDGIGEGPGIVRFCQRNPNLCVDPEFGPGIVEIPCDGRVPCYGVDPVPYNCKVKYACPGCGGGVGLCPPYYHMFFDGLDPERWRVELYTGDGEPVDHRIARTDTGIVLSFRPGEARFEPGAIGDFKIGFALEEGAAPREAYRFGARLERAAEPYGRPDTGGGASIGPNEDCLAIDAPNVRMVEEGASGYVITDGRSRIAMASDRADAKAMVKVVSRHTHHCFIGRDNDREDRSRYITEYWKGRSDLSVGYPASEDCLAYDPAALRIVDEGARGYLLTDGDSRMLVLDDRDDAERALRWAKRHTRHCFVGRDNQRTDRDTYILEYWK